MIKVLGHLAPDTDSTCAPIVYSWFLNEVEGVEAKPVITGEINKEAEFVLEKLGLEKPELIDSLEEGDQIVVVDTNNPEELVDGYEKAEIIEIIDHHKLAGLTTTSPMKVTIRPLACTMTVIWEMIKDEDLNISKDIAGLMLAGIISDTLKFTSPTTTDIDKEVAEELAEIADIDIDNFAEEMFAAKSDLSGMSAKDLILSDSKLFEFGDKKVRIGVLETTKPQNAIDMEEELEDAVDELREEESLDAVFFFVVDIMKSESHLLVEGEIEEEIAPKAFGVDFGDDDDWLHLPGVVSRKKQMVPNIEKAIG